MHDLALLERPSHDFFATIASALPTYRAGHRYACLGQRDGRQLQVGVRNRPVAASLIQGKEMRDVTRGCRFPLEMAVMSVKNVRSPSAGRRGVGFPIMPALRLIGARPSVHPRRATDSIWHCTAAPARAAWAREGPLNVAVEQASAASAIARQSLWWWMDAS